MRRAFTFILAMSCLCSPAPAFACLWDSETEMVEMTFVEEAPEDLVAGFFPRHGEPFHRWRIEQRWEDLDGLPSGLWYLDDIAVSHEKVGEVQRAIEIMELKNELLPGVYQTHANLGTFLIHAGRLEEGLRHIRRAIEINPEAHFGREIYQQRLVEYLMKRREEQGDETLPLGDDDASFADYLARQSGKETLTDEAREAAITGVMGMMRFGNHDSPVLLEALGDLLTRAGANPTNDERRLAFRAYMNAGLELVGLPRLAYKRRAMAIFEGNPKYAHKLRKELKEDRRDARRWMEQIEEAEAKWIQAGEDPQEEFAKKFLADNGKVKIERTEMRHEDRAREPTRDLQKLFDELADEPAPRAPFGR